MTNLLMTKQFLQGKEIPETFRTNTNIIMQAPDVTEGRFFIDKSYLSEFNKQYPNIEIVTPIEFTKEWFLKRGYIDEAMAEIIEEDESDLFVDFNMSDFWQEKIVSKFCKDIAKMTDEEVKTYIWENRDEAIKKYVRPVMIDYAVDTYKAKLDGLQMLKHDYINDDEYVKVR
jgi:hypothetical protein